jgi:hypothetical protein
MHLSPIHDNRRRTAAENIERHCPSIIPQEAIKTL